MNLRLVFANLLAHPLRSALTFLSVAVAVFLLCFLTAANRGLSAALGDAANDRLWVQSAVSLYVDLPLAYQGKIESVPGATDVCKFQYFGGRYGDEFQGPQFAVDPERWLRNYPELEITSGDYQEFIADRTGCVVGRQLAERYDLQIGDPVPLRGTIFPRGDGGTWVFTVRAIYKSNAPAIDELTLYFAYDYLRESLESRAAFGPDGVGVYLVKLGEDADATQVAADVDALFENGPQRVQTTTEAEFQRQFVSMLGNVPQLLAFIGGGVLFAIFFAVLNTMLMAGRERTHDLGIMKALGFSDGAVAINLVVESVLLCVAGGLFGGLIAYGTQAGFANFLVLFGIIYSIDGATFGIGLCIALVVGLIAGGVPGLVARRLTPIDALGAEA